MSERDEIHELLTESFGKARLARYRMLTEIDYPVQDHRELKERLLAAAGDDPISTHFAKTTFKVTAVFFSLVLAGCDSAKLDVEPPSPRATATQHLIELAPKLSTHNLQPMFVVEAVSFKAVDESGLDWWGSDEIYAVWQSNAIASTRIEEDVDSGDSVDFHELQTCIYPIAGDRLIIDGRYGGEGSGWLCKEEGGPGPINFSANFFEDDSRWASLPYCFSGSLVADCEDTFIGIYIGNWSNEELMEGWPSPGSVQDFTVQLNPCEGGAPACGGAEFPDYEFDFRITRMADKEILSVHAIE